MLLLLYHLGKNLPFAASQYIHSCKLQMKMWNERSKRKIQKIINTAIFYLIRNSKLFCPHPTTPSSCNLIKTRFVAAEEKKKMRLKEEQFYCFLYV